MTFRTGDYDYLRHHDKFCANTIHFARMRTYGCGQGIQRKYATYGLRISGKTCEAPRPDLVAAFIFDLRHKNFIVYNLTTCHISVE